MKSVSTSISLLHNTDEYSPTNGVMLYHAQRDSDGQLTDFRLVMLNDLALAIWDRPQTELIGRPLSQLVADNDARYLIRQFSLVVEFGRAVRFRMDGPSKEGETHQYDLLVVKLDDGVLVTYDDLTDNKQAELEAQRDKLHQNSDQQQNTDLLEQVMNMTPAAIVMNKSIRNEAGEIIDLRMMKLNQTAADILQNPIEKIQYRRISKYMPGSLETHLFAQCKQVIETGIPRRVEVPWADRWYDFSVARFGDGVVLAAQDITPMHQYQHQLERANSELKRSNENLQSFAFVASHDLQEPLRKIISFSDILTTQHASQFDTATADIVARINASASRMRLLIQDLLAYSQVETHQDSFVPVNLFSLIQELQEHELWETIHQRKAEISLGELPVVMADQLQMRQLFQNLLSNAIKFCLNDTTPVITVSSRLIAQANIPTGLMLAEKSEKPKLANVWFSEISITDNGIGFDEKYLDRIFQVFQRLNGRSQYAGSGIGLAISHKIVERHGGGITATSQLEKGSTFRIYLPVRKGV